MSEGMTEYLVEVQFYVMAPNAANAEYVATQTITPLIRSKSIVGWKVADVRSEDEALAGDAE